MTTIGVIGGGLAGLTVALRCAQAGRRVVVLEASERLGGQLHTVREDGFTVEYGAEGFVAQSEAVRALAAQVGLQGEIIAQAVRESSAFDGRKLVRLAPGEAGQRLGFQVSPRAFGKGIESMRDGMSQLVTGLREKLEQSFEDRVEVLVSQRAQTLCQQGDQLGVDTSTRRWSFSQVVVAIPAAPAAPLLTPLAGAVAADLSQSACSSSVTVSLSFGRDQLGCDDDTSGFIVGGQAQQDGFRACSYSSTKLAGRGPSDQKLVRVFMRPKPEQLSAWNDQQWAQRAQQLLATAIDVTGSPSHGWVSRWENALPIFDERHTARVAALEATVHPLNIVLAGAAFHGAGIDGAVRSAQRAADRLLA